VPPKTPSAADPLDAVDRCLVAVDWTRFEGVRSVAIAVNDKTRPVPHRYLLPPLLRRLESLGLPPEAITLIIATGTHAPMRQEEFPQVVPPPVLARYAVHSHDADERENLLRGGTSSRGTPIWINRRFAESELRIVVGTIEPHQFQGFSGGVKSAAIGLAGRETVNRNHAMITDPRARLGNYADNPARQDVEEIGRRIGVHLALNAILNEKREIVRVIAGDPQAVMDTGIPLVRQLRQVPVEGPFDLVVASPGGHPKDINLYQAQKALAHAGLVTREGGTVILAAACPEGSGSHSYESWVREVDSHRQVLARFGREPFRTGPHKAYLISRDASRMSVLLVSELSPDLVRRLLLEPCSTIGEALAIALADLPPGGRVGIMPRASSTIPFIQPQTRNER
jgi:nickel-dependent lactate racemase